VSSTGAQQITVNGEPRVLDGGRTIADLLVALELGDKRVAVARNRDVVPRSQYASTRLTSGDRIEILEAVGGG